jgi:hypothetical protein
MLIGTQKKIVWIMKEKYQATQLPARLVFKSSSTFLKLTKGLLFIFGWVLWRFCSTRSHIEVIGLCHAHQTLKRKFRVRQKRKGISVAHLICRKTLCSVSVSTSAKRILFHPYSTRNWNSRYVTDS